jgi:hypothetical protein
MKDDLKALCCHLSLVGCLLLKILSWPFVKLSDKVSKIQAEKK